jgi:hypothetical protein
VRQAIGLHVAQHRDREQSRRPHWPIGLLELAREARRRDDIAGAPTPERPLSPCVISSVCTAPKRSPRRRGALSANLPLLRRYSVAYDVEERTIEDREWAERVKIPYDDKDARQKKWLQDMQSDQRRRNLHDGDFKTRFRPGLVAYKEKICKRLQFTSPCPQDDRSSLIDIGMLAGANPIQEFADYLEQISRLLPDDSH